MTKRYLKRFAVRYLIVLGTIWLVFEPAVAQMQEEYFASHAEGRPWKARWVVVRNLWGILNAAGLQVGVSLVKRIWRAWKASSGV